MTEHHWVPCQHKQAFQDWYQSSHFTHDLKRQGKKGSLHIGLSTVDKGSYENPILCESDVSGSRWLLVLSDMLLAVNAENAPILSGVDWAAFLLVAHLLHSKKLLPTHSSRMSHKAPSDFWLSHGFSKKNFQTSMCAKTDSALWTIV